MTPTTRTTLTLVLAGAATILAPTDPTALAASKKACPDPTPGKCKTKGYLDSRCGLEKAGLCKDVVVGALEAQYKASRAPKRKMLPPHATAIPDALRTGKYHRYKGPKSKRYALGKKGKNAFARQRVSLVPGPPPGKLPLTAHRSPKWESNGNLVASCQEYAYEKLYDWSRFVDATSACRGSDSCVASVTLQQTAPGLDHPMKSRDKVDKLQDVTLHDVQLPKNIYFSFADKFAYAEGPDGVAPDPKWDALADTLRKGAVHYYVGKKPPKKKRKRGTKKAATATSKFKQLKEPSPYFKDEFAFHRAMRKKNEALSAAEKEEYARRRRLFQELTRMWFAAHLAETSMERFHVEVPALQQQVELPFSTQSLDELQALLDIQTRVKKARVAAKKIQGKLGAQGLANRPGARWISRPVAPKTGFRSLPEIDSELRTVLAAPAPRGRAPTTRARSRSKKRGKSKSRKGKKQGSKKKKQLSLDAAQVVEPSPNAMDIPCSTASFDPFLWNFGKPQVYGANNDVPVETLGYGPISCRIGTLLRFEWERHLAGERSCLDLYDAACDWEPTMLVDRFVDSGPYLQDYSDLETQCTDWAASNLAQNPMPAQAVDDAIIENKQTVGDAKTALTDFNKGKNSQGFNKYGFEWSDSESWGDKSTFGAKYTSSIGWSLEATKFKAGAACLFNGEAHADLSVKGYLIGATENIVDALGRVTATADGVTQDARLLIMGNALFNEKNNAPLTKAWEPASFGKSITLPKPKPTIYVQAGPVPVSGSAWGELYFGADLSADGRVSSCSNPDFKVGVGIGPVAMVGAAAQVGVGISGFLSAGVRGHLNLLTIGLPFEIALEKVANGITFGGGLDMMLESLSGRLSLYIEYIIGEDEFEIVSWKGIGPETIDLFELPTVSMPLLGFDK